MHFGEVASKPVSKTPAPRDGQWARESPGCLDTMLKGAAARSRTPGVSQTSVARGHRQESGVCTLLPESFRLNRTIHYLQRSSMALEGNVLTAQGDEGSLRIQTDMVVGRLHILLLYP